MSPVPLSQRKAWRALEEEYRSVQGCHLREFFSMDPARAERLSCEGAGLYLDYSKHRVTDRTLTLLRALATESGLLDAREGHVPRRPHQPHRGPGSAPYGPPGTQGRTGLRGWPGCGA